MKKIKLQALKEGEYDIEEIIVDDDGKIQRVIPKVYNEVYKGLNLFQETCEVGENPILLRALAIYGLMLPCVVSEAMDWINETYFSFENIIFYPVTTTEDYMKEIYYKDMSITLDKDAFYPLYQKYNNILGIEEYILDEHSEIISYPIRIDNLNWIFKSRCTIATLMKQQLMEWRKILPKAYFMIEYYAKFQLSDKKGYDRPIHQHNKSKMNIMGYKRTVDERQVAVERLKINKKKCQRYNFFGEDNHQHLDIMIDVIKNERLDGWIYETFPSCNKLGEEDTKEHAKWVTATNARDYLKGEIELKDLLYPED